MSRTMINTEHIEGRLYQHDLSIKQVKNESSPNFGKDFISGTIDIATDEEGLNVLTVHFTYVTETTSKGNKNQTFAALQKIISDGKAWITDGKDAATKVKIDTALGLNDFYSQDDSLVSVKTNEGGFVTIVNELCDEDERNTFIMDAVITTVTEVEADEEKGIEKPYLKLRGAVFNFRKELLPVEFTLKNPMGMKYFEESEVNNANPMFTKVWGKIISTTIVNIQEEESAFGEETAVRKTKKNVKEWLVTGASKQPYDFGGDDLTEEELTAAMQARQVMLATKKQQSDEYRANRAANMTSAFANGGAMNAPTSNGPAPVAKQKDFNF